MPTVVALANAVDREVEWLTADLSPDFPPLIKGSDPDPALDGPFHSITPRLRRISQGRRQVHVYRESFEEGRIATGVKAVAHTMLLVLLWPITNVDRPDTAEQAALDTAIDRLVTRVRALPFDHTHGGRFDSAGESGELSGGGRIEVRYPDWRTATNPIDAPLGAGAAYVVEIRYPAVDYVEG